MSGVTLLKVIPGVTWIPYIYIYREREREGERERERDIKLLIVNN